MSRYSNPYCNPHNIKLELDNYVMGQEKGTRAVATAIAQHLIQSQYASDSPTDNVLLIGPTGCGKTETFRCLQRLERRLKCPVLMVSVLDYAATNSWQGCSITDIFKQIFQRAATLYYSLYDDDNDDESPEEQKSNIIKIANRAIVLLDEADKISLGGEGKSLQFLKEYQSNLLKIVEGNTYPISDFSGKRTILDVSPDGEPIVEKEEIHLTNISLDTTHMLFILLGAFDGLEEITRNRLDRERLAKELKHTPNHTLYQNTKIGFMIKPHQNEEAKPVTYTYEQLIPTTEDIIEYGFMRELVGRIAIRTVYKSLNEDALLDIMLRCRTSAYRDFQRKFRLIGQDLRCDRAALKEIARIAIERGNGARGLRSVFSELLSETWYNLAGSSGRVRCLLRGREIKDHKPPLLHAQKNNPPNRNKRLS